MIPEPHATWQGAVTWQNQCHDRATLQGVIIPSAILKIVFRHILFLKNPVWALRSGGFRIVADTLVLISPHFIYHLNLILPSFILSHMHCNAPLVYITL